MEENLPATGNEKSPAALSDATFGVVLKTGPEVLTQNQDSHDKALGACSALLEKIKVQGMNDQLDIEANELLIKVNKTSKALNERRAPVTQIIDAVAKMFTSLESDLNQKSDKTIPYQIVKARNDYAQKKLIEQREKEALAKKKLNEDNERSTVEGTLSQALKTYFANYVADRKQAIKTLFDGINLETFVDTSLIIDDFSIEYPQAHFDKFTASVSVVHISRDELPSLKVKVVSNKYAAFAEEFETEISTHKQGIIDLLPSRKRELEEIAEAKRLEDIETKRREKEIADLAAINKTEADRKQKELDELAAINKTEADRKQKEIDDRNAAETLRLETEAIQKQNEINSQAQAEITTAKTGNLFAHSGELFTTPTEEVGRTKVVYKIEVTNPAGYLLIAAKYFEKEKPSKLTIENLEKKTFAQMRTFIEKLATDNEEFIVSEFIAYSEKAETTAK